MIVKDMWIIAGLAILAGVAFVAYLFRKAADGNLQKQVECGTEGDYQRDDQSNYEPDDAFDKNGDE